MFGLSIDAVVEKEFAALSASASRDIEAMMDGKDEEVFTATLSLATEQEIGVYLCVFGKQLFTINTVEEHEEIAKVEGNGETIADAVSSAESRLNDCMDAAIQARNERESNAIEFDEEFDDIDTGKIVEKASTYRELEEGNE